MKAASAVALSLFFCFSINAQTAGGWSYLNGKTYTNPLANFVGIGKNNPAVELDISGAGNTALNLTSTNSAVNNAQLQLAIATCTGCFSPIATTGDKVIRTLNGPPSGLGNDLVFDVFGSAIRFATANKETMTINSGATVGSGFVTIGEPSDFTSFPAGYRLYVKDGILTEKVRVAVKNSSAWSDFVFDKSYRLRSLGEVERFVKDFKHLPGVPSAEDVVNSGIDVASMDALLLQKIEELTLYIIEIKKVNEKLVKQSEALNRRLDQIERK